MLRHAINPIVALSTCTISSLVSHYTRHCLTHWLFLVCRQDYRVANYARSYTAAADTHLLRSLCLLKLPSCFFQRVHRSIQLVDRD